jgi:C4-dicarboxylate-specific signal transduction histidine kinase
VRYQCHCYRPLVTDSPEFNTNLKAAESAAVALESLAETFAPLASRSFRRGRRDAVVEESIGRCLTLSEADLKKAGVPKLIPPKGTTRVAVDPGELDTILLNLILNALYWIPKSRRSPQLAFSIRRIASDRRVAITVNDSGEGVSEEDADRIFLPGVTRKPGGIGMGLTVAAELVSEYEGNLVLVQPGKLGGASFTFDLPVKT